MSVGDNRQNADKKTGRDKRLANLTGGSRKGIPNKTTVAVKQALIEAFEQMGGVARLAEFAKVEPGEFYKLWVKILPQEISGVDGAPLTVQIVRLADAE